MFPGDVREETAEAALSQYVNGLSKLVSRFTRNGDDLDSVIEVITVFKTPHIDIQNMLQGFAEVLRPHKTVYGVKQGYPARDTLYADAQGVAYEKYGVQITAAILVRPDQHVAGVFEMSDDGLQAMDKLLSRVLVPAQ